MPASKPLEKAPPTLTPKFSSSGDDLERVRVARYEKYQGVFLVHSWRPSRLPGQMTDIVLRLRQHGDGPLKAGLVDHVRYALGPRFFDGSIEKKDRSDSFRLEVSAYSPMLCVARVCLTDGSSFELERYVDFEPTVTGNTVVSDPRRRLEQRTRRALISPAEVTASIEGAAHVRFLQ